jgi:hypothetical protein
MQIRNIRTVSAIPLVIPCGENKEAPNAEKQGRLSRLFIYSSVQTLIEPAL